MPAAVAPAAASEDERCSSADDASDRLETNAFEAADVRNAGVANALACDKLLAPHRAVPSPIAIMIRAATAVKATKCENSELCVSNLTGRSAKDHMDYFGLQREGITTKTLNKYIVSPPPRRLSRKTGSLSCSLLLPCHRFVLDTDLPIVGLPMASHTQVRARDML